MEFIKISRRNHQRIDHALTVIMVLTLIVLFFNIVFSFSKDKYMSKEMTQVEKSQNS